VSAITLPAVTVGEVLAWGPCDTYTKPFLEDLWAGRKALTAVEIGQLKIPRGHRLWAVVRDPFLTDEDRDCVTCELLQRLLLLTRPPELERCRSALALRTTYIMSPNKISKQYLATWQTALDFDRKGMKCPVHAAVYQGLVTAMSSAAALSDARVLEAAHQTVNCARLMNPELYSPACAAEFYFVLNKVLQRMLARARIRAKEREAPDDVQ
jgi:hypothetical protein